MYARWSWLAALASLIAYAMLHTSLVASLETSTELNIGGFFVVPLMLLLAALFALPSGVRGALWLFERIAARMGAPTRLAASSLAHNSSRAMLTTATPTIGLMRIVALSGMALSEKDFFKDAFAPLFDADFLLLRPSPSNSFEEFVALLSYPPLPPDLQADLDALAALGEADVLYQATIHLPQFAPGPGLDAAWAVSLELMRDRPANRPIEGSCAEADRYFAQARNRPARIGCARAWSAPQRDCDR